MNDTFPYMIISAKAGRGYFIDEVSPELDSTMKEAIRQNWSPEGQGWSQFVGISFIRTIHLPNNKIGWVQIRVTSDKDEFGRSGLLHAKIIVVPRALIDKILKDYLDSLPSSVKSLSKRYLPNILGLFWRTFWNKPTIISAPSSFITSQSLIESKSLDFPVSQNKHFYTNWSMVEAVILLSYLLLPKFMRKWVTISTFSLSINKAGTIIGIPNEYLQRNAHITFDIC